MIVALDMMDDDEYRLHHVSLLIARILWPIYLITYKTQETLKLKRQSGV
jgi:hypothetical protein